MAEFGALSSATALSESELGRLTSLAQREGSVLSGNALKATVEWAACRGLNKIAEKIYEQSQIEVPESLEHDYERYPESLAETGRYPGNDIESRAIPAHPVASVSYTAEYAWAQHEGEMTYYRDGKEVVWQVENYSKESAKTQYLADPFKAMIPEVEAVVGEEVALALRAFQA